MYRSDWHGWVGHDADIELPHVPGHELAGTIVAVGKGVKNWRVDDRVTVPFVGGCGSCSQGHAGHQQVCDHQFQPGFTHWAHSPNTWPCIMRTSTWLLYPTRSISRPPPVWDAGSPLRFGLLWTKAESRQANGSRCMGAVALGCPRS